MQNLDREQPTGATEEFRVLLEELEKKRDYLKEVSEIEEECAGNVETLNSWITYLDTFVAHKTSGACAFPLAKGSLCAARGKSRHGFCGHHQKVEQNADFQTAAGLAAELTTEDLASNKEDMQKERDKMERLRNTGRSKIESTKKAIDELECKAAKLRGGRETAMFAKMTELGIRLEPYQGDMTMNGPNSLKFIRHFEELATLLEDGDMKENLVALFASLQVIVIHMFTTAPLRVIPLTEQEWEFLEGPLDKNTEMLTSDLEFLQDHCHFHGNLFAFAFPDIPPPKHHFAVFHVPQFAALYGSLGMFAEQGMERSHSTSNTLNRKLRPITETLTLLRRKFVEYAAKASLSVPSPDRIEMGVHGRR